MPRVDADPGMPQGEPEKKPLRERAPGSLPDQDLLPPRKSDATPGVRETQATAGRAGSEGAESESQEESSVATGRPRRHGARRVPLNVGHTGESPGSDVTI